MGRGSNATRPQVVASPRGCLGLNISTPGPVGGGCALALGDSASSTSMANMPRTPNASSRAVGRLPFLILLPIPFPQIPAIIARTLVGRHWPLVGTLSPVANTYTPCRGLLCSTVIANKLISRTSKR
jgi:hypothetical protein